MHFRMKSILKSNRNHIPKQTPTINAEQNGFAK
jgi:hypothetical protein